MSQRSLGYGKIGALATTLYTVPAQTQTTINLMSFSNNSSANTLLTLYKQVKTINYSIGPLAMSLPAGYLAQEDGVVTLNANDSIVAISSIDQGIDFMINGTELPLIPAPIEVTTR